jgi:hypothetical protein
MLKKVYNQASVDLYRPTLSPPHSGPFGKKEEKIMLRRSRIPSPSPRGEGFRVRSTRCFFLK